MSAQKFWRGLVIASVSALVVLAGAGAARADDGGAGSKFDIDFTPYLWLPTLNGTFHFRTSDITTPGGVPIGDLPIGAISRSFDTQVGPNNYLSHINFALMGTVTAHFGRVGLYGDVLNANVSNAGGSVIDLSGPLDATISTHTQIQIVSTLWTIAPSYTVYRSKSSSVDFVAGAQGLTLSTNANLQLSDANGNMFSGAAARKETYSNFIVGGYGHVGLGGHWSVPFYLDAGFGTPTSWEGIVGVKYGRAALSWRYLQFNAVNNNALLQRLTLGGPMFGYTIQF
jgi:hypothetical protein